MKKKNGSLNKKLLHKMTATAMPMEREKPRLHLTGSEAKAVHDMKPGAKVSMAVHGKLTSIGLQDWGLEKGQPVADMEIYGMKMMKGKKDKKGKVEDKAEGEGEDEE